MTTDVHSAMRSTLVFFGIFVLSAADARADAPRATRDAVVGCWNVGEGVTLDLAPSGEHGLVAMARFSARPRGGPERQRTRARWVERAEAFELGCRPRSQHGSFCHVRPDAGGLEVRVYARARVRDAAPSPVESLVATRCAVPAAAPAAPIPSGFTWTPLGAAELDADLASRWGVVVDVADTTRARFEPPYDRYALTTPHCAEYCITVARVRTAMPSADATIAAFVIESEGENPAEAVTLASGITPTGVVFVARRFGVRMGTPGVEGQTIHFTAEVSRFFAVVPVDASSHLVCTGYVEHAVTSMDDPAMRAARDVCLSLGRVR